MSEAERFDWESFCECLHMAPQPPRRLLPRWARVLVCFVPLTAAATFAGIWFGLDQGVRVLLGLAAGWFSWDLGYIWHIRAGGW